MVGDVEAALDTRAIVVEGNDDLRATLLRALDTITGERMAILDCMHPLAAIEDVRATVAGLDDADACVCAVPVKETLKLVKDGVVEETLDRSEMWHELMPQAFRVAVLVAALERGPGDDNGAERSDLVRAVERMGGRVAIVPGSSRNLRLTTRDDLKVAHAMIKVQ